MSEIKDTEKVSVIDKLDKPDKGAETNKFKGKLDNYCKECSGEGLKSKETEKGKLGNYCKEECSGEGLKSKETEKVNDAGKLDKSNKDSETNELKGKLNTCYNNNIGNQVASARALGEKKAREATDYPLTTEQEKMAQSLIREHRNEKKNIELNPKVANDAVRGGSSVAGKNGEGADVRLLNGGGREVSIHAGSFDKKSIGSHLQDEAGQRGTSEIYMQISSINSKDTPVNREEFLKMVPDIRKSYQELDNKYVKIYGDDGSVWWNGKFKGPKN